ncbi:MAG: AraC family transcriptional regulator [Erysipelotrichaceae bacterium]|nr:MAG: AraC family transcriptional regulator [Erysipelotrichaceae bacterium]
MINRQKILEKLKNQINDHHHLLGVALGSGLTAKYAEEGGADFLLALNSGKYRQLGRGSIAGFLAFEDCNGLVMNFGTREIMPLIKNIPLIFGLNATDPMINLETYIEYIQSKGFDGINNYPSIGLIDGQFREALEEEGMTFETEVKAIQIAHDRNMFTVAFVFNEKQALDMAKVGADVICAHLGFTSGGSLGVKKVLSLERAKQEIQKIFDACDTVSPDIIKVIYGGPVKTPLDVQYMYNNTSANGYIGGSAIERIPLESSIKDITKAFKTSGTVQEDDLMIKMLDGINNHYDYPEFVMKYIANQYQNDILLADLARVAHISVNYLSALFKKEVGTSFKTYLVRFRIEKAIDILNEKDIPLYEVAELVGFNDYAQFSKMFKKVTGKSPNLFTSKSRKP